MVRNMVSSALSAASSLSMTSLGPKLPSSLMTWATPRLSNSTALNLPEAASQKAQAAPSRSTQTAAR